MPERLVHLDLKGAPPTPAYIDRVLPLLKSWGCTGLLVEYEDMFPYDDDLAILSSPYAYSKDDIGDIIKSATDQGLKIIPLIQTFGHFEFVLKHSQFSSFREVPKYPMALCPSNLDSLSLIAKMLDQVLKLHSHISYLHLGCDEVFHLGLCYTCSLRMEMESIGKEQLFFSHVKSVATYIKQKYPHLTCIIWDDMFRFAEHPVILECGLGDLVEPMVWHYQPHFQLPASVWDNLSLVFPNIWAASAFKGAMGPCATVTNIHFHLDNHRAWINILENVASKFKSIRGIALTGWQRYDHYAVLCELFPQALPCLALCLQFIQKANLTPDDITEVAQNLKFTTPIPFDPISSALLPSCEFPGSPVYQLIIEFYHYHRACCELFNSDGVSGWLNEYHVKRGFINPVHVEPVHARANSLSEQGQALSQRLDAAFSEVFVPGVVDEWRGSFLEPLLARLSQLVTKTRPAAYEGLTLGGGNVYRFIE